MAVGIDIGNDSSHIVAFDPDGQLVMRKQIKQLASVATFEKLPPCAVGLGACLSAHFVSRTLPKLDFEPRIIPAIYMKPFIKDQENDCNDAEAIAEAALRPKSLYARLAKGRMQLQAQKRKSAGSAPKEK